jgi:hypothetical protein
MDRKLLIFGNGLGMAINPAHYSLANALNTIWSKDSYWSDLTYRSLIENCIPASSCPKSEEGLDKLHLVATSCDFLSSFSDTKKGDHWLSSYGKIFTQATQEYIHTVASYLFNSVDSVPSIFCNSLINFIKISKSHVATLNYDQLLYKEFIGSNVCNGYTGCLVDGFYDSGFSPSNMERRYNNNFGYYMHLHGCPLFQDVGGITYKQSISSISTSNIFASKHIVLTHIKHKPSVISASEVLSTYWSYLILALNEVEDIILFGYSGLDIHLNQLLKLHGTAKNITIVEWDGDGSSAQVRQQFWRKELGKAVTLQRLPDITQFTSW